MQTKPRLSPPQVPSSPISRVAGLGCLVLTALEGFAVLLAVLAPLALVGLAGVALAQAVGAKAHAQSASAAPVRHVYRNMDILLNKLGVQPIGLPMLPPN